MNPRNTWNDPEEDKEEKTFAHGMTRNNTEKEYNESLADSAAVSQGLIPSVSIRVFRG